MLYKNQRTDVHRAIRKPIQPNFVRELHLVPLYTISGLLSIDK